MWIRNDLIVIQNGRHSLSAIPITDSTIIVRVLPRNSLPPMNQLNWWMRWTVDPELHRAYGGYRSLILLLTCPTNSQVERGVELIRHGYIKKIFIVAPINMHKKYRNMMEHVCRDIGVAAWDIVLERDVNMLGEDFSRK